MVMKKIIFMFLISVLYIYCALAQDTVNRTFVKEKNITYGVWVYEELTIIADSSYFTVNREMTIENSEKAYWAMDKGLMISGILIDGEGYKPDMFEDIIRSRVEISPDADSTDLFYWVTYYYDLKGKLLWMEFDFKNKISIPIAAIGEFERIMRKRSKAVFSDLSMSPSSLMLKDVPFSIIRIRYSLDKKH